MKYQSKNNDIKTNAFILGGKPFGEHHKMMKCFTKDLGLISIIAYGVRKSGSRFGGDLSLFNEVGLLLESTSEEGLYNIKHHHLLSSRYRLWEKEIAYTMTLFETGEWIQELLKVNQLTPQLYDDLGFLFSEELSEEIFYAMNKAIQLKLMYHLGYLSSLKECTQCSKEFQKGDHIFLSPREGFFVCSDCATYRVDVQLSIESYRTLYKLLYFELSKVKGFAFHRDIRLDLERMWTFFSKGILGKNLISRQHSEIHFTS